MASGVPEDTAYAVGVILGKASNPRTWEAGVSYQSIEKDALFAQFIDSDFGDGVSDAEGWVLKAGYAPTRNVTVNGTYFINTRNVCGTGDAPDNRLCGAGIPEYELDYNRWQLDVNYKF
jgi:Putative porin